MNCTIALWFPIVLAIVDRRSPSCEGADDGLERDEGDEVMEASTVAEERPHARSCAGLLTALAIGGPIALLTLQAVAAERLELAFDEAYYALWSRSLAFGYLDHPPMVAFLIRASTALFGGSELGVRALSLLLVGALPALVAVIAWRLFRSAETAALAVLLWIAMPLVMAGAVFATPDAPLVVFWALGLAALVELWRSGKAQWLLMIGLALGLMLQSKFTAAFFAAGVALAFMTTPSLRRWLVSPASAVALAIAAAIFAPFVAWNAVHGWATFIKQLGRAPPHGFEPFYLLEFVAAQIGLMNPLVFAPFAAAVAAVPWRRSAPPGSADEARCFLVATIAPATFYFLLHALHDRVQGNWLAPLFPASAVLAADWVADARWEGLAGVKGAIARGALWAAPLGAAAMILAFAQAETGALPLGAADPTVRLEGFREFARELDVRAKAAGAPYIVTQGYALTSLMRFYGDPSIAVVQPDQRIRWIFEPSPPESLFASPGLALAETGRRFDLILKMRFRSVEPLGALERRRAGQPIQAYELYRVAEPYAPVLDPPCPSGEVDLQRKCAS
jgi:Dolichyl-phosphate-mannose-protein mannosyltransferase